MNDPLKHDEKRFITWDICRRPICIEDRLMTHLITSSNDATLTKHDYMMFLKGIIGSDTRYEELQQHIMNATVDDLKNICDSICESLPKRNGYVVCHNKILSSLICDATLQYTKRAAWKQA